MKRTDDEIAREARRRTPPPPLVKGGQGHDAEDVEAATWATVFCYSLAAIVVAAVYLLVS